MNHRGSIALLCAGGLLLGLIVWLPANFFGYLLPDGVTCTRLSGTLWRGTCTELSIRGSRSGSLQWTLTAPTMRPLAAGLRLAWQHGDSAATAAVLWRPNGVVLISIDNAAVDLGDIRAALPSTVSLGRIAALAGRLETRELSVSMQRGKLADVVGTLALVDTRLLRDAVALGAFQAKFFGTRGEVSDLGGPIKLAGTVSLPQPGQYAATAKVTASDNLLPAKLGVVMPLDLSLEGGL